MVYINYTIYNSIYEMIEDRRLKPISPQLTKDEYTDSKFHSKNNIIEAHSEDGKRKLLIFLFKGNTFDIQFFENNIKKFNGQYDVLPIQSVKNRTISGTNSTIKKLMKENPDKFIYQPLDIDLFLFNPYRHVLVPDYYIMNEDEKKELFKNRIISQVDIPKSNKEDVIIKWIGAKVGDVIRILDHVSGTISRKYYEVTDIVDPKVLVDDVE